MEYTNRHSYSLSQLMVTAAAQEISDGEIVFVGMRLPLLGFLLAKSTHAPSAVGIYELGIVRDRLAPVPILTMGDLPNLYRAQWCTDSADVMGLLQQGKVDTSFIGGAQLDRFGNLNTNYIGGPTKPDTRLPGSGGACDLGCLSKRHVIIMVHEKRRFVEQVDFITTPGYGSGSGWRKKVGLPRGGPTAVITNRAILRFDPLTREMVLTSIHPGVTVQDVLENTGWPLRLGDKLDQTPVPTQSELEMLHRFDPDGYWTGSPEDRA